jgi:hypothetical protein
MRYIYIEIEADHDSLHPLSWRSFLRSRRSRSSKKSEKELHKCSYLEINYRTSQKVIVLHKREKFRVFCSLYMSRRNICCLQWLFKKQVLRAPGSYLWSIQNSEQIKRMMSTHSLDKMQLVEELPVLPAWRHSPKCILLYLAHHRVAWTHSPSL